MYWHFVCCSFGAISMELIVSLIGGAVVLLFILLIKLVIYVDRAVEEQELGIRAQGRSCQCDREHFTLEIADLSSRIKELESKKTKVLIRR